MDENSSFFSTILIDCGYKLSLTRNLTVIFLLAEILLICIVGFIIFDILLHCSKRSEQKNRQNSWRHSAWMSNFTLRYFYEFFFEVFLCTLIHLVTVDNEYKSLQILSVIILIASVALIGFTLTLFVKGGPYMPKSFDKSSLLQSYWGKRPLHPDLRQMKNDG